MMPNSSSKNGVATKANSMAVTPLSSLRQRRASASTRARNLRPASPDICAAFPTHYVFLAPQYARPVLNGG